MADKQSQNSIGAVTVDADIGAEANAARPSVDLTSLLPPEEIGLDGATAKAVSRDDGRWIEVRDGDGRLVFAYEPLTGRARVMAPRGDLTLAAPDGNLHLAAGKAVTLDAPDIAVSGGRSVVVESGKDGARLSLKEKQATLKASEMRIEAEQANLLAGEARWQGAVGRLIVDRISVTADRVETVAKKAIERLGDSFRDVGGLLQDRVGRLRLVSRDTIAVKADKVTLKAEEDVKVTGKKIHLG